MPVSGVDNGAGADFSSPSSMTLDASRSRLIVEQGLEDELLEVETGTGNRRVLVGDQDTEADFTPAGIARVPGQAR